MASNVYIARRRMVASLLFVTTFTTSYTYTCMGTCAIHGISMKHDATITNQKISTWQILLWGIICVLYSMCGMKAVVVVKRKVHSSMCLWVLLLVVSKQMWSLVCNQRNIVRDLDVNLPFDGLRNEPWGTSWLEFEFVSMLAWSQ